MRFLPILLLFSNPLFSQILLNEIVASNANGLTDFAGDTPDWVELYNPSNQAIELEFWQIKDDNNSWDIPPVTIAAKSYLIIFASDKNGVFNGEFHANFKLKSAGETLQLYDRSDNIVDEITYPNLLNDQSYGRISNTRNWQIFTTPSPNASNSNGSDEAVFQTQLSFSKNSGFYDKSLTISLLSNKADRKIYFTTDGSLPDTNATLYQQALLLNELPLAVDSLAFIPTSTDWSTPTGILDRTVVLRAQAFHNGQPDSKIETVTYFKKDKTYTMPVVALTLDQKHLMDKQSGIYVAGENENYLQRGQDWERPVQVDFFDKEGELLLQQNCGLRVGGAKTRLNPQKTLRLYARDEYGEDAFNYPFWGADYGQEFKKITLRTLYNVPWSQALAMDDFAHAVIDGQLQTDYVRSHFVVVFINGVYWGIHSMREHNNEDFLARKYNLDDDNIKKYSGGSYFDGTAEKFVALSNDLETMNLAKSADFQAVSDRLDIYALADYIITNLAMANKDWPTNNLEWWSADTYDGKIRFLINDLDATMQAYNEDRLSLYFELEREVLGKKHRKWAVFFLQKLLENTTYRQYFNRRMNELLRTTFAPQRTTKIWQQLISALRPEMEAHTRRWHYPKNVKDWESAVTDGERFLVLRPDYLLRSVDRHFGTPLHVFPNPTASEVTIDFELYQTELVSITVIDMQGRICQKQRLTFPAGVQQTTVNLTNLSGGIYTIQVDAASSNFTNKIVKY